MAAIVAERSANEEISRSDPRYPGALLDLPDPPPRVWARGNAIVRPRSLIIGPLKRAARARCSG